MNYRALTATGFTSLAVVLALAGCGGSSPDTAAETTAISTTAAAPETTAPAEATVPVQTTPPAETTAPVETTVPSEPLSDIEAAVQEVVTALDDLDIAHSEPVRAEVGGSGAKARFDLTINGFDAGINIFADEEQLQSWSELSDSLGGVHIAFDNSALSLNSSEGIAASAEIAPAIAEALGGKAHGV